MTGVVLRCLVTTVKQMRIILVPFIYKALRDENLARNLNFENLALFHWSLCLLLFFFMF